MLYSECVSLFLEYIYSYTADSTIEYYLNNLSFFGKYLVDLKGGLDFDINELTKMDYIGYITYQRKRNITNTSVRTYSRAIKVFLNYLYSEGILKENITVNVKMPRLDNRMVIPLTSADVGKYVSGINKSPLKIRNKLIFSLMLCCGLRKSEVINLNLNDVDLENNYIKIVNSKFNKSRMLPLPVVVSKLLSIYITEYRSITTSSMALILSDDKRITDKAINCMFSKLKKYNCKNIYPHLLRHTFATSFILSGGSLEILRLLLGHSDYNVTRNYIHIAAQCDIANIDVYRIDECFLKIYRFNI